MRPAGFWVRALAHLIDSVILNLVAWILEVLILGVLFLAFRSRLGEPGPGWLGFTDAFNALYVQVFAAGIYVLIAFPYFVWGHFRYGTTLGKLPLGIRVVGQNGEPVTYGQSAGRFCGYLLSYLPLGAGFLMAAFHPEKRALHELVSGTRSVRILPDRSE